MSFENNNGLNVSNHYGPRAVGGTDGSQVTANSQRIFTIDLDGEKPLVRKISVPAGIAENVHFEGSAGSATVSVGSTVITAASWGTPVSFVAGDLTAVKGSGAGKVKITMQLNEA